MHNWILYLFGVSALVIIVSLLWRKSSQTFTIPCPSWLSFLIELDNPFARCHKSQFIVDHLELKPGMNVLDAGSGPGRLTIPLAQIVGPSGKVTALDMQQAMLDRVQEKAKAENLHNIEYIKSEIGKGGCRQTFYDRVVLVSVLGEIPDRQNALKEIQQCLKPGGYLSISETLFDPHYQSRKSILSLAHEIGFKEKYTFGNALAYTIILEKL